MTIEWTEQISVGNNILDLDHKELFELSGKIDCAVKTMDHSGLVQAFKLLKGCMDRHFLNEELLAHTLNIPFAKHQQDHQNMLAGIDLMRREIVKDGGKTISAIKQCTPFLQNWLIKHITEEDLLMKPMLQAHPYDFRIEGVFIDA